VLLEIDEDPRWAIVYPAAILRSAPHAETARKFFAWLQQPDNLRVFGDSGFIVLPAGSS
jgi:ABC-type molybdate transport system substrate-binding protein